MNDDGYVVCTNLRLLEQWLTVEKHRDYLASVYTERHISPYDLVRVAVGPNGETMVHRHIANQIIEWFTDESFRPVDGVTHSLLETRNKNRHEQN